MNARTINLDKITQEHVQIICEKIIDKYKALEHEGYFTRPGEAGHQRLRRFLQLKDQLSRTIPPGYEGVIKLYDFYKVENKSSRLNQYVALGLVCLLGLLKEEVEEDIENETIWVSKKTEMENIIQAIKEAKQMRNSTHAARNLRLMSGARKLEKIELESPTLPTHKI